MDCGTYGIETGYRSLINVKILTANISKCSIISGNFQADGRTLRD
jgi:putative heme iron utilization protein